MSPRFTKALTILMSKMLLFCKTLIYQSRSFNFIPNFASFFTVFDGSSLEIINIKYPDSAIMDLVFAACITGNPILNGRNVYSWSMKYLLQLTKLWFKNSYYEVKCTITFVIAQVQAIINQDGVSGFLIKCIEGEIRYL